MNRTCFLLLLLFVSVGYVEASDDVRIVPIGEGWAKNAVNAVIFRRNAVVSHNEHQYVSYYDADGYVVLARRKLGSTNWETRRTRYQGKVTDAHNSISMMVMPGKNFKSATGQRHSASADGAKSAFPYQGARSLPTQTAPVTRYISCFAI